MVSSDEEELYLNLKVNWNWNKRKPSFHPIIFNAKNDSWRKMSKARRERRITYHTHMLGVGLMVFLGKCQDIVHGFIRRKCRCIYMLLTHSIFFFFRRFLEGLSANKPIGSTNTRRQTANTTTKHYSEYSSCQSHHNNTRATYNNPEQW